MSIGPWQILLVLVLALVLFGGRGKISALLGDMGKGIKSFKKGLADEEVAEEPAKTIPPSGENNTAGVTPKKDESVNG
jgi:sec-independent protein translocase protein TatA